MPSTRWQAFREIQQREKHERGADIPQEVTWHVARTHGAWAAWHWCFLGRRRVLRVSRVLLFRTTKRHRGVLGIVGAFLLLLHYLDTFWLIMPDILPVSARVVARAVGGHSGLHRRRVDNGCRPHPRARVILLHSSARSRCTIPVLSFTPRYTTPEPQPAIVRKGGSCTRSISAPRRFTMTS